MPLNVRCTRCHQPVSLDEAFAGGVCRCPHCREMFLVQARAKSGPRQRPEAPEPADAGGEIAPPHPRAAHKPGRGRTVFRAALLMLLSAAIVGGIIAAVVIIASLDAAH